MQATDVGSISSYWDEDRKHKQKYLSFLKANNKHKGQLVNGM